MSSELIERLRDYGLTLEPNVVICDRATVDEAAATIAQLQAELADLQQTNAEQATIIIDYAQQLAEAREVPGRIVAFIQSNVEVQSSDDTRPKYWGPRKNGNTHGLEYATAIEARDWSKP